MTAARIVQGVLVVAVCLAGGWVAAAAEDWPTFAAALVLAGFAGAGTTLVAEWVAS